MHCARTRQPFVLLTSSHLTPVKLQLLSWTRKSAEDHYFSCPHTVDRRPSTTRTSERRASPCLPLKREGSPSKQPHSPLLQQGSDPSTFVIDYWSKQMRSYQPATRRSTKHCCWRSNRWNGPPRRNMAHAHPCLAVRLLNPSVRMSKVIR